MACNDFKNVWSYVSWYVKVCISENRYVNMYVFLILKVYSVHKHWDKTEMSKRFPSDKKKAVQGMSSFFFVSSNTVLLLICDSYTNWSTRLVSLKLCVRFSIFNSVLFLYFCSTKYMDSMTLKCHNSFQN